MPITRFDSEVLYRAREGDTFLNWLNNGSGFSSQLVFGSGNVGSGVVQAIPNGSAVVVNSYRMQLQTNDDWLDMEIGHIPDAASVGTFVPLTPKLRMETGTNYVGEEPVIVRLPEPLYVKGSDAGAITVRVQTKDDAAIVGVTLGGWVEPVI